MSLSFLDRLAIIRADEQMHGVSAEVRTSHRRGPRPVSTCANCGGPVCRSKSSEPLCGYCRERIRASKRNRTYKLDIQKLVELVGARRLPASIAQVASATGLSHGSANQALSRAVRAGYLVRVDVGVYAVPGAGAQTSRNLTASTRATSSTSLALSASSALACSSGVAPPEMIA